MPCLQVVHGDRADGGELWLAGVGTAGPVDQLGRLAAGDSAFIIVAAHDPGGHLLLRQLQLLRAELGMKKQVHGKRENLIPREGCGIHIAAGLDVRRLGFEQVVEGVAAQLGCAAGAPCLTVEADQPRLGRILVARAAGNRHRAGDERQLVILLQEEHDAVFQFNALGLVGLEVVQLRDGDQLPGLGLLGGESGWQSYSKQSRNHNKR